MLLGLRWCLLHTYSLNSVDRGPGGCCRRSRERSRCGPCSRPVSRGRPDSTTRGHWGEAPGEGEGNFHCQIMRQWYLGAPILDAVTLRRTLLVQSSICSLGDAGAPVRLFTAGSPVRMVRESQHSLLGAEAGSRTHTWVRVQLRHHGRLCVASGKLSDL